MKKKFDFYDFLALLLGAFCFMSYYFAMTEYFFINPFSGFALIPTIYFAIAVITLPFVYGTVNDKIGNFFLITLVILLTIAYVFGPIIFVYQKLQSKK